VRAEGGCAATAQVREVGPPARWSGCRTDAAAGWVSKEAASEMSSTARSEAELKRGMAPADGGGWLGWLQACQSKRCCMKAAAARRPQVAAGLVRPMPQWRVSRALIRWTGKLPPPRLHGKGPRSTPDAWPRRSSRRGTPHWRQQVVCRLSFESAHLGQSRCRGHGRPYRSRPGAEPGVGGGGVTLSANEGKRSGHGQGPASVC